MDDPLDRLPINGSAEQKRARLQAIAALALHVTNTTDRELELLRFVYGSLKLEHDPLHLLYDFLTDIMPSPAQIAERAAASEQRDDHAGQ